MKNNKGFSVIGVLIAILILVIVACGGVWYVTMSNTSTGVDISIDSLPSIAKKDVEIKDLTSIQDLLETISVDYDFTSYLANKSQNGTVDYQCSFEFKWDKETPADNINFTGSDQDGIDIVNTFVKRNFINGFPDVDGQKHKVTIEAKVGNGVNIGNKGGNNDVVVTVE